MAAGSMIYKAQLSIADMDRNYYETHEITIAKHPSESVIHLHSEGFEKLSDRSMRLQCNISDRELSFHSDLGDVTIMQENCQ